MLKAATEDSRPATILAHRLGDTARSRAQRAEDEEAHCNRRAGLASTVCVPLYDPSAAHLLIDIMHRALDFTAQALRKNLSNPSEELSTSFRDAYGNTLKQYHSFLVKPIFSAAMSATPYRKDFYAKLGDNQDRVHKELSEWLAALEEQVSILKEFLGRKECKY